jgi:hypothetical protein
VGWLCGTFANFISDVSKATVAAICAATRDGITDSLVEAAKQFVAFQHDIRMRQALDVLAADE